MKQDQKLSPTQDLDCSSDYERVWDRYDLNSRFGIYWRNKASDLNAAAVLLGSVCESNDKSISPEKLGLGRGFSFKIALPPVFRLNAGLSIELLLKACIVKRDGHRENLKNIHRLNDLAKDAGFNVNDEQETILSIMTEYIYWRGRYPVPKDRAEYDKTLAILSGQRTVESTGASKPNPKTWLILENYQHLWKELVAHYDSIPARRNGDS